MQIPQCNHSRNKMGRFINTCITGLQWLNLDSKLRSSLTISPCCLFDPTTGGRSVDMVVTRNKICLWVTQIHSTNEMGHTSPCRSHKPLRKNVLHGKTVTSSQRHTGHAHDKISIKIWAYFHELQALTKMSKEHCIIQDLYTRHITRTPGLYLCKYM